MSGGLKMDRQTVFDYIKKKYRVTPEYPWKRDNTSAVFRHADNNKWFALVMDVKGDRLGLPTEEFVDAVNLKIDDLVFRDMIIKEDGIMPAYHMNKMHWITVLLDGSVPAKRVYDLIDMSFMATASAKKKAKFRPPKEWIIPSNPKYYDIQGAFEQSKEIDWKQGKGIKKDDIVYMYVAAPISAILYKCRVTKTDIPFEYDDGRVRMSGLMKIKLLKRYKPDKFTLAVLDEKYGISTVRGPRGIPDDLSRAL